MEEQVFAWLKENPNLALLAIPALAFLEATVGIGLLVSGVFLLSVATFLYAQEIATLYQILPLAFFSALAADHVGFYLGILLGPEFHQTRFARRFAGPIGRGEEAIQKHGQWAVLIGRLVTAIRSVIPLLCGLSSMDRVRFSSVDFLACAIWTTGLGMLVVGIDAIL